MIEYVIVGNGIAGVRAAEAIRARDLTSPITIVCDERGPAYSRVLLPHVLSGEMPEARLTIREEAWYATQRVRLLDGDAAVGLRPEERRITLASGRELSYDRLLVATGGSPAFPPIRGLRTGQVFGFRSVADVRGIMEAKDARRAVVVGAGPIGLLAAEALLRRGLGVTVVEMLPQVLPQMLDATGAAMIEAAARRHGLKAITDARVAEVLSRAGRVSSVGLGDGRQLDCDILLVATGVVSNLQWLRETGMQMGRGIVVDDHMRTSLPDIWAAGDVCETTDVVSARQVVNALWPGASEQGRVAALDMVGLPARYDGSVAMNSATFFGIPCIGIGQTSGEDTLVDERREAGIYRRAFFQDERLVGVVLAGDVRNAGVYLSLMRRRVPARLTAADFWSLDYSSALHLGQGDAYLLLGTRGVPGPRA
ncbi:MAG: FAD-dependent oxidoreductase [Bacteroidetes bacterium]|nr:FAD-dependent oxidoreductase [Bacteroidota bacterium]